MLIKRLLFALCLLVMATASYASEPVDIAIKTANLSQHQDSYFLNGRIHYSLSEEAIDALHHGVTLNFNVEVSIIEPRRWLWSKHHHNIQLSYQIKYHTLAEIYQVSRPQDIGQHNFASLDAALHAMGSLNEIPIHAMSGNQLTEYYLALDAYLNIEALPLPMRPLAYLSPGWHLQSNHYLWSPQQ